MAQSDLIITPQDSLGADGLEVNGGGNLLTVRDLRITFNLDTGPLQAVRGVNFRVPYGKTVALVGESGSGKSVVAQAILGILPKIAQISGGRILFDNPAKGNGNGVTRGLVDIAQQPRNGPVMRSIRGSAISIIFQEPMTSLSPVHTIGDQIGEALALHRKVSGGQVREMVEEMLRLVGFPDPKRGYKTYPFELSGGLRQRAMIAMALICRPTLLIADEPTTALDVTIQAQILELLADMKQRFGMAIMLITHAMGVVAETCQRVTVMYAGKVVEEAPVEALFGDPRHPYTQGLIRSIPRIDRAVSRQARLESIQGTVPSLLNPPPGCRFAARCKYAMDICTQAIPPLKEVAPGHRVACVL
jgi:oligopeptide/dipeptide ABC transporter ATP-binding protein